MAILFRSLDDPRLPALLAVLFSGGLLLGALGFEHLGGYPPCELCHWQRYAHVGVLVLGLAALAAPRAWTRGVLAAVGLALLACAGLAGFHVGVENQWWEGLDACAAGQIDFSGSVEDLTAQLMAQDQVIPCDEPVWTLFKLSMADYNLLLSAAAALALGGWLATRGREDEAR